MYEHIDMKKTGILLKYRIEKAGYTVKDIQKILQLSCPQPIYRWFKGMILPSVDHLYVLSRLLKVHTYVVNSFSKIHPLSNRIDNLDLPNSSHHSIFFHAHENVPSPTFPSRCILYDRMAYIFPLPALYMMPYVILDHYLEK